MYSFFLRARKYLVRNDPRQNASKQDSNQVGTLVGIDQSMRNSHSLTVEEVILRRSW